MQTLKAKWALSPVKINKPAPSAKGWLSAYFWSDPDGYYERFLGKFDRKEAHEEA